MIDILGKMEQTCIIKPNIYVTENTAAMSEAQQFSSITANKHWGMFGRETELPFEDPLLLSHQSCAQPPSSNFLLSIFYLLFQHIIIN